MDFIKRINRGTTWHGRFGEMGRGGEGGRGINLFLRAAFDCTEVKRYWDNEIGGRRVDS